jgi:hypothetical protein
MKIFWRIVAFPKRVPPEQEFVRRLSRRRLEFVRTRRHEKRPWLRPRHKKRKLKLPRKVVLSARYLVYLVMRYSWPSIRSSARKL